MYVEQISIGWVSRVPQPNFFQQFLFFPLKKEVKNYMRIESLYLTLRTSNTECNWLTSLSSYYHWLYILSEQIIEFSTEIFISVLV